MHMLEIKKLDELQGYNWYIALKAAGKNITSTSKAFRLTKGIMF